ncbi:MAG: hypothetical protein GDA43_24135 [Hormoscilla sp. SP5CHS1]|nr:hypothetical protein [Hormoscilla sp. SP5CHS1]
MRLLAVERSYGFRPGRSTHDAQQMIFNNLSKRANGKTKVILETDISKCFDMIEHEFMLREVILPPEAKKGLRVAIKAGVKGEYPSSERGTPQGGVISPLLANIALDGFEEIGSDQKVKTVYRYGKNKVTKWSEGVRGVRYADDAIFICKPGVDIQKLQRDINKFLKARGLTINEDKTKVSKATEGFDFLGWHFRVNSRGRFKSTPSQENYANIKTKIKQTWKTKAPTEERLKRIESQVRGWRQYHQYCDMSKHSLWSVNSWTWKKLRAEKRKQSLKEAKKQRQKLLKGHKPERAAKRQSTDLQIKKAFTPVPWKVNSFVMVKGTASPFDGKVTADKNGLTQINADNGSNGRATDTSSIRVNQRPSADSYWVGRNSKLYTGPTAEAIKRQKGRCKHCNQPFLEVFGSVKLHHIDGDHNNWSRKNLVALHRPCHQAQAVHRKRIKDGQAEARRKGSKSPEPDEVKVSRPGRQRRHLRCRRRGAR